MEREIGEQFYIDNEKYEIVKGNSEKCLFCCFNNISCINVKKNMQEYVVLILEKTIKIFMLKK